MVRLVTDSQDGLEHAGEAVKFVRNLRASLSRMGMKFGKRAIELDDGTVITAICGNDALFDTAKISSVGIYIFVARISKKGFAYLTTWACSGKAPSGRKNASVDASFVQYGFSGDRFPLKNACIIGAWGAGSTADWQYRNLIVSRTKAELGATATTLRPWGVSNRFGVVLVKSDTDATLKKLQDFSIVRSDEPYRNTNGGASNISSGYLAGADIVKSLGTDSSVPAPTATDKIRVTVIQPIVAHQEGSDATASITYTSITDVEITSRADSLDQVYLAQYALVDSVSKFGTVKIRLRNYGADYKLLPAQTVSHPSRDVYGYSELPTETEVSSGPTTQQVFDVDHAAYSRFFRTCSTPKGAWITPAGIYALVYHEKAPSELVPDLDRTSTNNKEGVLNYVAPGSENCKARYEIEFYSSPASGYAATTHVYEYGTWEGGVSIETQKVTVLSTTGDIEGKHAIAVCSMVDARKVGSGGKASSTLDVFDSGVLVSSTTFSDNIYVKSAESAFVNGKLVIAAITVPYVTSSLSESAIEMRLIVSRDFGKTWSDELVATNTITCALGLVTNTEKAYAKAVSDYLDKFN